MKIYIILLMIFTISLFAEKNTKFGVGVSLSTILVNNDNYGYFSKNDLATEFSIGVFYEVIKDLSVGLNFENLLDDSSTNSFDYLAGNMTLSYSYNTWKQLDIFTTINAGYQKSYFKLNEEEFNGSNLTITPYLGIKSNIEFKEGKVEFAYEIGYKYQVDTELKTKIYSRNISYGNFSASGIKQKFTMSILF